MCMPCVSSVGGKFFISTIILYVLWITLPTTSLFEYLWRFGFSERHLAPISLPGERPGCSIRQVSLSHTHYSPSLPPFHTTIFLHSCLRSQPTYQVNHASFHGSPREEIRPPNVATFQSNVHSLKNTCWKEIEKCKN